jgi:hypothetical protein
MSISSALAKRCALVFLSGMALAAHAGPDDTVWTSLFNGKDLKDWDIKTNGLALNQDPKQTYRVADSAIEVNYSNYANWNGEPWSHIGYKVRPFSHYLVRLEYQFYGKQVAGAPAYANENSGIMLHSQSLASVAQNQNWPISLELQFLGTASTLSPGSGNLCTPGTAVELPKGTFNDSHCINVSANNRIPAPAWTRAAALVLGDSLVRHFIEDKAVLTYYKPMTQAGAVVGNSVPIVNRKALGSGYILLQSESAPIRFRRIQVADLVGCKDPASSNYKSYYVKHDSAACKPTAALPGALPESRLVVESGSRLRVDLAGDYALRLTDLEGRSLWSARGRGRRDFQLAGTGARGLVLLAVEHAGGTYARKVVLDP